MFYRFIKRGFDIFNSLLAIIFLLPLFLLICVGIKISSKGPILFVSERVGRNNKVFLMYKFRSMHLREAKASENQYLVNEKRIFPFGKFLRKSKLDELPQLFNILKGDMSIVGPRPYPKKFADREYIGVYNIILSVRPGLACLDSLFDYAHGELFVHDPVVYSKTVLPIRTELAKIYVAKQNVWMDLYCIIRTVLLMLLIVLFRKTSFRYTAYEKYATDCVKDAHQRKERNE